VGGFTLIELIVSIGVLLLLTGGLLASYNNYNQRQQLRQTAITLKANLRLAQSKAMGALKPASGCTQLAGYSVSFTLTTYSIQAQCTEGLVGTRTDVTLPEGVSFTAVPPTFVFGVVTGGLVNTDSAVTFRLSSFGTNYRLVLSPTGDITDVGFE